MHYFKPTPYLDYLPPKLSEGKLWYVYYSVLDPATGRMIRFRHKINRYKTKKEKQKVAKVLIASYSEKLALGWNPLIEKIAPKSFTKFSEAAESFLNIKSKENEFNSMRSYKSYIKILEEWLNKNKYGEDIYIASFSEDIAEEFMDSVEVDVRISARTYNNYRAFYTLLWNWFIKKKYAAANPFININKKPKKLTKKTRRTLNDSEINRLFQFLEKENQNYLSICLLCYCCFMRPKEITLLKCSDIDLQKQTVHVSDSIAKNDNESYRTIPDAMIPYIAKLDLSNPRHYIFSETKSFAPGMKKICSREIARYWADVVRPNCNFDMDIQFYSLKDTGITNMLASGMPASFVKQQADHSDLSMTSVYLGKTDKANEAIKHIDVPGL